MDSRIDLDTLYVNEQVLHITFFINTKKAFDRWTQIANNLTHSKSDPTLISLSQYSSIANYMDLHGKNITKIDLKRYINGVEEQFTVVANPKFATENYELPFTIVFHPAGLAQNMPLERIASLFFEKNACLPHILEPLRGFNQTLNRLEQGRLIHQMSGQAFDLYQHWLRTTFGSHVAFGHGFLQRFHHVLSQYLLNTMLFYANVLKTASPFFVNQWSAFSVANDDWLASTAYLTQRDVFSKLVVLTPFLKITIAAYCFNSSIMSRAVMLGVFVAHYLSSLAVISLFYKKTMPTLPTNVYQLFDLDKTLVFFIQFLSQLRTFLIKHISALEKYLPEVPKHNLGIKEDSTFIPNLPLGTVPVALSAMATQPLSFIALNGLYFFSSPFSYFKNSLRMAALSLLIGISQLFGHDKVPTFVAEASFLFFTLAMTGFSSIFCFTLLDHVISMGAYALLNLSEKRYPNEALIFSMHFKNQVLLGKALREGIASHLDGNMMLSPEAAIIAIGIPRGKAHFSEIWMETLNEEQEIVLHRVSVVNTPPEEKAQYGEAGWFSAKKHWLKHSIVGDEERIQHYISHRDFQSFRLSKDDVDIALERIELASNEPVDPATWAKTFISMLLPELNIEGVSNHASLFHSSDRSREMTLEDVGTLSHMFMSSEALEENKNVSDVDSQKSEEKDCSRTMKNEI